MRPALYQKNSHRLLLIGQSHQVQIRLLALDFVQLLHKATDSVRMHSTYFEGMSRRLADNNERNQLFVGAEEGAEKVVEVTAKRDNLLLGLNYSKVSRELS